MPLIKARLNRTTGDTSLDTYFSKIAEGAEGELSRIGITLVDEDVDDLLLLVDLATWRYQSRDQSDGQPLWLRQRIRERWLSMKGRVTDDT